MSRLALPAALAVMAGVYAAGIPSVRTLFGKGFVDTRFLPKILVAIAAGALLAIIVREVRTWLAERAVPADDAPAEPGGFEAVKPFVLFAAILAYIAAFKPVGFLISNMALGLLILWLFEFGVGRPVVRVAAAAAVTAVAYLLFAVAFGTRLALLPGGY
ncbi:tripartite tricarboxylate transporter TctB family protein [Acuticoccus sp. I52.16.1]|uniref:tripartite tricarboxylate transporter TctB family protein n=1 Tax=Acuticoccus sp. I52.16.1 TaxID=2928472 RepID=UPI001FD491F6|nr:tripartite tricarboxylate transporter TctB family protein [Acuticoccus sp. I52.16.1]UOM33512.1 tripartite tricarboxylate transporter TctB family protein [Acuticoccus sp. I52.16.1]